MQVSRILEVLADAVRLADRVERRENSIADMALAFRQDSKARDRDFLEHDRRIQKLENLIEFAEKFTGRPRIDAPENG